MKGSHNSFNKMLRKSQSLVSILYKKMIFLIQNYAFYVKITWKVFLDSNFYLANFFLLIDIKEVCAVNDQEKKLHSINSERLEGVYWKHWWKSLFVFTSVFMPPRSKIGEHIVFVLSVILSFLHSVILSETLTLLITFQQ